MDFLNQSMGQARELILSMTPAARITALLLLGVIGISLGYLLNQHTAGPDDYLFSGELLSSRDADQAEAAIAQAGLTNYERVGNRIRVPSGQKATYLGAIADAGKLPTNYHDLLEKALDVGPFVDRVTRQQRMKAARERQLSMIISEMDDILDAKVIFDTRKGGGLSRSELFTATVSVRPASGDGIEPLRIKMIRKAVSGAIAGLNSDDVTITNVSNGSIYGSGGGDTSAELLEGPYFQNRIAYERLMKENVLNLLHYIPGARVQVSAELDETLERTTHTVKPEGEGSPLSETKFEEESSNLRNEDGGRPGPVANGPNRSNEPEKASVVQNKKTNSSLHSENLVGTRDEQLRETGMVPKDVFVAVAIPSNYLVSVWRERELKKGEDPNKPLPDDIGTTLENIEEEVTQDIQSVVSLMLPKSLAQETFSKVNVTVFESLTPEEFEGPSTTGVALHWAGNNFSTITMAVLAVFSLVMLRSMVKSIPPGDAPAPMSEVALSIDTERDDLQQQNDNAPTSAANGEPARGRLRLNKGPNLKDDLTEMVREDPDSAAAILRTWIGNSA